MELLGAVLSWVGILWLLAAIGFALVGGLLSGLHGGSGDVNLWTWPAGVSDLVRTVGAVVSAVPAIGMLLLGIDISKRAEERKNIERNRLRREACAHEWTPPGVNGVYCPKCGTLQRAP